MALPDDYVGSDIENLNLDPYPEMAYEPYLDADGTPYIRYSQHYYRTKIYVLHEDIDLKAGMIILWHGEIADIPTGWALCDGSNGTPNLTNKFVVCADADDAGTAKTTIAGVAQQTGGHLQHLHPVDSDSHVHGFDFSVDAGQDGSAQAVDYDYGATGGHVEFDTDNTSDDEALPPFYALAYIMKT